MAFEEPLMENFMISMVRECILKLQTVDIDISSDTDIDMYIYSL